MNTFDEIRELTSHLSAVRLNYSWGLIDDQSNVLLRFVYDYISIDEQGIWARYAGRKFYVSLDSLPLKYDYVYEFKGFPNGSKWAIAVLSGRVGVIDDKGKIIVPCMYDSVQNHLGAFWVEKNRILKKSLYGIYSYEGNLISDCVYLNLASPVVTKEVEGKILYGLLSHESKELVRCENDKIWCVSSFKEDEKLHNIYVIERNGLSYIYHVGTGLINTPYREIFKKIKDASSYQSILNGRTNLFFALSYFPFTENQANKYQPIVFVYEGIKRLIHFIPKECIVTEHVKDSLFICKSKENGKYSLIDESGYRVPFIYESISFAKSVNLVIALKEIRTINFSSYPFSKNYYICDIYTLRGNIITQDIKLSNTTPNENELVTKDNFVIANNKGLSIYHESLGETVHLTDVLTWDLIDNTHLLIVKTKRGYGILTFDGRFLLKDEYTIIQVFSQNLLFAQKGHDIEYYAVNNDEIKKLDYSLIVNKKKGLVCVTHNLFPFNYNPEGLYTERDLGDLNNPIWGVIDIQGNEIIPCANPYNEIKIINEKYLQIGLQKYDIQGNALNFPLDRYCNIRKIKYSQYKVAQDNTTRLLGLIDEDGLKVCDFIYTSISSFDEKGVAVVTTNNNMQGLINAKGELVVPCIYPELDCSPAFFQSIGFILYKSNNKYGLIDLRNPFKPKMEAIYDYIDITNDNFILPHTYFETDPTKQNFIIAHRENGFDILDTKSKEILFIKDFTSIILIYNDIIVGLVEDKYRLYSISQKEYLMDFAYDNIGKYWNKPYLVVEQDNKWGIFDLQQLKQIIPCLYYKNMNNPLFYSNGGYFRLSIDDKYGYADIEGNIVIPFSSQASFKLLTEGIIGVCEDSYWGFKTISGQYICRGFDEVRPFCEGLAAVKKGEKWGFINKEGELIIPCHFAKVSDFSDGLVAVAFKKEWGYIDKYNNTVIPFIYSYASHFKEGLAEVSHTGGEGHIDKKGNLIDWENYPNSDYSRDYSSDTWDAMTDGMCGDYPGDDFDYDCLGF